MSQKVEKATGPIQSFGNETNSTGYRTDVPNATSQRQSGYVDNGNGGVWAAFRPTVSSSSDPAKRPAVQFTHHDLGFRSRGEIVEVTLSGNAANVRLLDSSNFSSYRAGRRHRAYGGLVKRSPVRLAIPYAGHWHVAVDLVGLRGSVRSSACIVPGPLPEYR